MNWHHNTRYIDIQHNDTENNNQNIDTPHNGSLYTDMLQVSLSHYAESRDWHSTRYLRSENFNNFGCTCTVILVEQILLDFLKS
jgi:hypothetical protein